MRIPLVLLCSCCLLACGARSQDDAEAGGDADADADVDADADIDADTDADAEAEPGCPAPLVWCAEEPPECPENQYPVADPEECGLGDCTARCWTGECRPCAEDCDRDEDCTLVGRHGCCYCVWATTAEDLARDPCKFVEPSPVPEVPPDCPAECEDGPECVDCPHCSPNDVRCEGGRCVAVWTDCEPQGCGCQ